jgi:hypothetical protein
MSVDIKLSYKKISEKDIVFNNYEYETKFTLVLARNFRSVTFFGNLRVAYTGSEKFINFIDLIDQPISTTYNYQKIIDEVFTDRCRIFDNINDKIISDFKNSYIKVTKFSLNMFDEDDKIPLAFYSKLTKQEYKIVLTKEETIGFISTNLILEKPFKTNLPFDYIELDPLEGYYIEIEDYKQKPKTITEIKEIFDKDLELNEDIIKYIIAYVLNDGILFILSDKKLKNSYIIGIEKFIEIYHKKVNTKYEFQVNL